MQGKNIQVINISLDMHGGKSRLPTHTASSFSALLKKDTSCFEIRLCYIRAAYMHAEYMTLLLDQVRPWSGVPADPVSWGGGLEDECESDWC